MNIERSLRGCTFKYTDDGIKVRLKDFTNEYDVSIDYKFAIGLIGFAAWEKMFQDSGCYKVSGDKIDEFSVVPLYHSVSYTSFKPEDEPTIPLKDIARYLKEYSQDKLSEKDFKKILVLKCPNLKFLVREDFYSADGAQHTLHIMSDKDYNIPVECGKMSNNLGLNFGILPARKVYRLSTYRYKDVVYNRCLEWR